jgi:hypothetical protein
LNRQLFTRTAAVAETKGRKTSIVAVRLRLTVHYTEHRAEATIGYPDVSAAFHFKSGDIDREDRRG